MPAFVHSSPAFSEPPASNERWHHPENVPGAGTRARPADPPANHALSMNSVVEGLTIPLVSEEHRSLPLVAGLLISIAAHGLLLWKLHQWESTPPVLGSSAAAVTVALVSVAAVAASPPAPTVVTKQEIHGPEDTPLPAAVVEPQPPTPITAEVTPEQTALLKAPKKPAITRPQPKKVPRQHHQKQIAIANEQPRQADEKPIAAPPEPTANDAAVAASEAAPATIASQPQPADEGSTEPAVNMNPRFRSQPVPPAYPRRARRLGQEGVVLVQARLNTDGNVLEVRLASSSGFKLLDEAAMKAVRKWEFVPARQQGKYVMSWVQVPVKFILN